MAGSSLLKKSRAELLERCSRMTPEERMAAFLSHNELLHRLARAGARYRAHSQRTRRKKGRASR